MPRATVGSVQPIIHAISEGLSMAVANVTPDLFRRAWSNFATGVTVVTTRESDSESDVVHGMTANGVASVSLEPPLALVVIGHGRNTHPLIMHNRRFGISVLASDQTHVARHYTIAWEERRQLPPPEMVSLGHSRVISGALATMDCRLVESYEAGDHTIFVGQVEAIGIGAGDPLLYYRSGFAALK